MTEHSPAMERYLRAREARSYEQGVDRRRSMAAQHRDDISSLTRLRDAIRGIDALQDTMPALERALEVLEVQATDCEASARYLEALAAGASS